MPCAAGVRSALPLVETVLIVQAINEVNLPKFLSVDLPLFHGIVHDLFPSSSAPRVSGDVGRAQLVAAVTEACRALELVPTPHFVEKVLQVV